MTIKEKKGKTTKSILVKSYGNNINLHPAITELLNAEKVMLKKDYEFDEAFNIFEKIHKCNKLN